MELESFPGETRPKNRLAQVSAYGTGIGWFLLFSFIFSDQILEMGSGGRNEGVAFCVGPLFLISMACLIVGVLTGHIAAAQIRRSGEEGLESARNGIKYGYLGIGYVVLAPLLNLVLARIGFTLPTIGDLIVLD